jgi:REP element-mobilizing transposase RayT
LHAVNCRTNHLHVVVTAPGDPKKVRSQFKAWCTRALKRLAQRQGEDATIRENWWAERGSQRYINDEASLEAAVIYVRDGQDNRD